MKIKLVNKHIMKIKFVFLFVVLMLMIGWCNRKVITHHNDTRYTVTRKYKLRNMITLGDSVMKEQVKHDKRLNKEYLYVLEFKSVGNTTYRTLISKYNFKNIDTNDKFLLNLDEMELKQINPPYISVKYEKQNKNTWLLK